MKPIDLLWLVITVALCAAFGWGALVVLGVLCALWLGVSLWLPGALGRAETRYRGR